MDEGKSTITKSEAEKLRGRLKAASARSSKVYLEVGGLLHRIQESAVSQGSRLIPLFSMWGYSSFYEYVETELGIHAKSAQRMVMAHVVFNETLRGKYDPKLLAPLGPGKLRYLMRLVSVGMSKAALNDLLRRADTLTCQELCQEVEALIDTLKFKRPPVKKYRFNATFTEEELGRAEAALRLARRRIRSDRRGEQLDTIISEWLESQSRPESAVA